MRFIGLTLVKTVCWTWVNPPLASVTFIMPPWDTLIKTVWPTCSVSGWGGRKDEAKAQTSGLVRIWIAFLRSYLSFFIWFVSLFEAVYSGSRNAGKLASVHPVAQAPCVWRSMVPFKSQERRELGLARFLPWRAGEGSFRLRGPHVSAVTTQLCCCRRQYGPCANERSCEPIKFNWWHGNLDFCIFHMSRNILLLIFSSQLTMWNHSYLILILLTLTCHWASHVGGTPHTSRSAPAVGLVPMGMYCKCVKGRIWES